MRPFKSAEEFKKFLDEALKKYEKENLQNVSLEILSKAGEERDRLVSLRFAQRIKVRNHYRVVERDGRGKFMKVKKWSSQSRRN